MVDTSVLIDHLRGVEQATELLTGSFAADDRVTASVLTKVEVLAGTRPAEARPTREFLSLLEWLPVDDEVAELAGSYARAHVGSHPDVDTTDYVIAATAARLGATLWTLNVRHFPMFPELEPPYGRPTNE